MRRARPKQLRFQQWKSAYIMRLRAQKNRSDGKRTLRQRLPAKKVNTLVAPSHFALISRNGHQNGNDVCAYFEFLGNLRSFSGGHLTIDMRAVRRMVADAALLFKAELSTLLETRQVTVSAIAPASNRTLQVLKQTGIDKLLNISVDIQAEREDVVHWRVAEGQWNHVDPNLLEPIMADIEQATGLSSHPIYQGIIESMGNCVEHAYKEHHEVTRKLPRMPGWWVFQQVRDNLLTVNVCDLGIGVGRALPITLASEEGLMKKLYFLCRKVKGSDNRALLAAMEYGRSSTGLTERGKGMRNAHAVVDEMGCGLFYAISNRGFYIYEKKSHDTPGEKKTIKLRHSINGTIMGWRLPLKRHDKGSSP